MISIAGGTGLLGTQVVRLLLRESRRVRVLTRDANRGSHLPRDVEVITGDLRSREDLRRLLSGSETVISAVHGFAGPGRPSPEATDNAGNRALIRAAAEAGVSHMILVSVHGARADHPMSLHRAKFAAEEELRKSGLAFTVIRPTAFMETWGTVIGGPLASKGLALVFGPGRNPINFVSVRDVASLVVRAVDDSSMRAQVLDIGGAEDMGFERFAQRLIEASGRPGRIKHLPLSVLRAMSWLARPFAPTFARQARAAVVMNTEDMTFGRTGGNPHATIASTTLEEALRC
jgi:NADH dehydrogenase